jgi:hypothetical protein
MSRVQYLTYAEQYNLHLLSCLLHKEKLFVPPSPTFAGIGGVSPVLLGAVYAQRNSSLAASADRILPGPNDHSSGMYDYMKSRPMSYLVTSGRVNERIVLSGEDGMFLSVNPWDSKRPLKWNIGSAAGDAPFWQGGLYGDSLSIYGSSAVGTSHQKSWDNNPFIYPTDYMAQAQKFTGGGSDPCFNDLYPNDDSYSTTATAYGTPVFATGFLIFPLAVRVTVDITHTGFTQTSIRAKTAQQVFSGSTVERLYDRIEDPSSGYYGLNTPPVASKHAEFIYRADRWGFAHATHTGPSSVLNPPPTSSSSGEYDVTSVDNWCSMQQVLADDGVMIEIRNVASEATVSSQVNIAIDVDYAISPLGLVNGLSSHSNVTADVQFPNWFSSYRCLGSIKLEGEGSSLPALSHHKTVIRALHEAASETPSTEMKHIAAASTTSSTEKGGFARFIDTVVDGIGKAIPIVSKVADVAGMLVPLLL